MPILTKPVVPEGSLAAAQGAEIAGDGLILRPWEAKDVGAAVAGFADPAVQRWHCRSMDAAEAAEWIAQITARWRAELGARWAVTEGGVVVGQIGLGHLDLHDGCAEISYWIVPQARGRGLAPRALEALCGWAFGELGLHRLQLEHSTANPSSCRVAEKAGFRVEGVRRSAVLHQDGWHDMEVHARIRGDGP
jgi:RimJ/RimL family protein N-acetyltransferase